MGLFEFFGKSLGAKARSAVDSINKMNIGVRDLRATVAGKSVTLEGQADNVEAKGRAVQEFNKLVVTENTINRIQVGAAPAAKTAAPGQAVPAAGEQIHVVVSGDTLSALAKKYYGKASLYKKIFEANRGILNNPDLIKVGQKLRIPK